MIQLSSLSDYTDDEHVLSDCTDDEEVSEYSCICASDHSPKGCVPPICSSSTQSFKCVCTAGIEPKDCECPGDLTGISEETCPRAKQSWRLLFSSIAALAMYYVVLAVAATTVFCEIPGATMHVGIIAVEQKKKKQKKKHLSSKERNKGKKNQVKQLYQFNCLI
ncbi:MAG: hypothetical protein EZS28_054910 [Streblomastix strix]|uniref:Uncharacterized protein n=1 Tax=Streblomastix strix TaxID=222440 RepID=A0A5J4QD84_9EUKA|nr:MAG: hypothetical protein EZS28_054910 [Streblomastix strix]